MTVITLDNFRRERAGSPPPPSYAEFGVTTNFSFLRGGSQPQEMVLRAAEYGLAAIGIADRNTLSGVVRAYTQARDLNYRLVVGARLVFSDGTPDILAYPSDRAAYGRLARLLTLGNRRAEKGDCILNFDDLAGLHQGLLFIVMPPRPRSDRVEPVLKKMRALVGDRVWLGAAMLYRGDDSRHLTRLLNTSERHRVPLIALADALYHTPERRELQDVLTCIREGVTIDNAGYLLEANAERHLKPPGEMARIFAKAPQAIAETMHFLARCNFTLEELSYQYPEETREGYATPQEALIAYTEAGAKWRFPGGIPDKVRKALDHELELIGELKYAPYFLTVHDIVRFARQCEKPILCQGRGSAANSVICYCLGITEVNPAEVDLLFERFVSAERREPPDIDVDFEHERREEVMQYIYKRYGRERTGIAATVICYRGRSAVRDVGKAFGLSQDAISALASTLWGWSEEGPADNDVRRAGLDPADKRLGKVLKLTNELIDFPRHLSQHVGGFVMTSDRLDEIVPIGNAAMDDRTFVEWDKDDLDALRILKVDVLALGMLTCIRKAFDFIKQHYGETLTIASVPKEEPAVYDMLCRANSIGVFQVESRAQMSMLPRLRPRGFYDLVIEVAIVRPGPIQGGMVHPYLKRRQGIETVSYPKKELEDVLKKTLGVPLFQEQAMRIAIVAAGFTPAEADKLRRAMATFRRNGTIQLFETKFIDGMVARGYERDFAIACFNQIKGFGDYGFPESHAASFAILVYVSSWLKCHYPDVFAAALLNAQPMGFYAPAQIVRDAQEHGVVMREADINASDWDNILKPLKASQSQPFPLPRLRGRGSERSERSEGETPQRPQPSLASPLTALASLVASPPEVGGEEKNSARLHPRHLSMRDEIHTTCAMRLGFREISGFKKEDGEKLMAVRGKGFDSVRDLWLRSGLEPSVLERLADADAFRSLGLDRRQALWAVRGLRRSGDKDDLPLLAFESAREREPDFALPPMLLGEHVVEDYRHLSLSLKAHPVSFVRGELDTRQILRNADLTSVKDGARVTVSGLVLVRQRPGTASGVIFMTIEDEGSIANIIVWPRVFERFRPIVLGSRFVSVRGKLQCESGVIHIVADEIEDLTPLLGALSTEIVSIDTLSRADEVKHPPTVDGRSPGARKPRKIAKPSPPPDEIALYKHPRAQTVMPKGRNFH